MFAGTSNCSTHCRWASGDNPSVPVRSTKAYFGVSNGAFESAARSLYVYLDEGMSVNVNPVVTFCGSKVSQSV